MGHVYFLLDEMALNPIDYEAEAAASCRFSSEGFLLKIEMFSPVTQTASCIR